MNTTSRFKEILDTTLRDGEQAPGVSFTLLEKQNIAEKLVEMHIDEIEAGVPMVDETTREFISWLVNQNPEPRISAWVRLQWDDCVLAAKTGVDIVHVSIPISKYHLHAQHGTWKEILERLDSLLHYARDHFDKISLGLQDSFRSDEVRLQDIVERAELHNIFRIRFADTVGTAYPTDVSKMVKRFRHQFSGKIDFHGHNDLGLGTANALAALEAGADSVNVTANGIGERAGNTSLAEIAYILHLHKHLDTHLDLRKIAELSSMVEEYSRIPIPLNKPIIGKMVFTHESGIHVNGELYDPLAYQPFHPENTGLTKPHIVFGTHSGVSNLTAMIPEAADAHSPEELREMVQYIKNIAAQRRTYLTQEEVIEIYTSLTTAAENTEGISHGND
jgi:homocitrate synthase NifV